MTPDLTDANLRDLIAQGLSQREIARRTGIPRGTLQYRLKRLGLQVPPTAQVQSAVQLHRSSVEPLAVQSAVQTLQGDVEALKAQVSALAKVVHGLAERPVQSAVQITTLPPIPPSKSTRWNLWLPTILQEEISRIATERGIPPSQLVKELLWKALQDR